MSDTDVKTIHFIPVAGRRIAYYNLKLNSPVMDRRMDNYGGQIASALVRVGTLLMFTSGDNETKNKVEDWVRECLQDFREEHEKINELIEESKTSSGMDVMIDGFSQEPVSFRFPINHPIANRYIECMKDIDAQQISLETLYFSGVLDEEQYNMASKQAVRPFNHLIDRIYNATNVAKRTGGSFDPQEFLQLLKQESGITALMTKFRQAKKEAQSLMEGESSLELEQA